MSFSRSILKYSKYLIIAVKGQRSTCCWCFK